MINFQGSFAGSWVYKYGTSTKSFDTSESQSGNIDCELIVYGKATSYNCILFAASTSTTWNEAYNNAECVFSGDLNTTTSDGAVFNSARQGSQYIDSVNKDNVSPLALTNAANRVPGYSYTNATLYEALCRRYPMYKSFCMRAFNTSGNGIPPSATAAGLSGNYNYSSGSCSYGSCSNAPGLSSDVGEALTLGGNEYDGDPDILEGEDWYNADALAMYLLLSEPIPERSCHVDMYFNGDVEPNISIEWKSLMGSVAGSDEILKASKLHIVNYAPADIQHTYTAFYTYIDSEDGIRKMNDLVYNQVNKLRYIKPVVTSDNKINSTYITQAEEIIGTMNTAARVLEYGINQLPENLVWYLQVEDPDGKFSSLWELAEPRESEGNLAGYVLTELLDARWPNAKVDLTVAIHSGTNQSDTGDDPPIPPPKPDPPDPVDWEDDEGHGFPGDAVLTKTYSMTAAVLQNVGQKLWTQSYFDVLKIQSNPIENIVSVKWFPFDLSTGTAENIKVGDVDFGIQGKRINTVKVIDIGTATYTGRYNNFLDGSPYTSLKLNLPYVGQIQLDASEFLGSTIGVKYIVDLVTGECVARIKRDGIPLYDYPGHMGVDIVLTASDRVQADMKAVSSGLHSAAGMAGEVIQGDVVGVAAGAASGALSIAGMDYNSQRVGSPSGVCGSFQNHKVWLTVSYPLYYQSEGFTHVFGRPCNKYLTLGTFSSGDYVQVDKRTDLKIAMTSEENAELERLLTSGVYI